MDIRFRWEIASRDAEMQLLIIVATKNADIIEGCRRLIQLATDNN